MLACVGLPGCAKDCPANLEIVPATLPTGKVGQEYRVQLGLEPALNYGAFWGHSGTLPPGLQFDVNSGLIEGTLTVAGTFQFRIAVGAGCDDILAGGDSTGAARDYEVVVEP